MPPEPELPAAGPPPRLSVLFICTGNTCRSPMAEALCKRLLAGRLGCDPGGLEARGVLIRSAGVAALPGDGAAGPAVIVATAYGADLSAHRSRAVSPELLESATHVVAMAHAHAAALAMRFPGVGPEPELLCGDEGDLPDPIGGDLAIYQECAEVIRRHLERRLTTWVGGTE